MSDDERIAKLTELAQRVWPDEPYGGAHVVAYGDAAWVRVRPNTEHIKVLGHPRALDALEAALLALAVAPREPEQVYQCSICGAPYTKSDTRCDCVR